MSDCKDSHINPLATPTQVRSVLDAHGLTTKYSLGQNFLVNKSILSKIIELADVKDELILEVGPGIGTLSWELLNRNARVIAIEKDSDLVPVLEDTLGEYQDRFHLTNRDALTIEADDLFYTDAYPEKLVANLPYAVAATVVLDYFQRFGFLKSATVMVQKEVADRMMASSHSKEYGAYTLKLALYAKPSGRFKVTKGNFFPPPRVDSSVIRLDRRPQTLNKNQLLITCELIDAAFAQRRKTIHNSMCGYFKTKPQRGMKPEKIMKLLASANINPSIRGEMLELGDFVKMGCLFEQLFGTL